ncbi:hypothetical protein SKA58_13223 [Sphingomonas sp. SKA58]|nr:hypothetical protein SKA58_13223 [Sphingomonas sp. SKA58]
MRHIGQRIVDAKRLALLARGGFAAVQRFLRAALQLGGKILVKALDSGQFLDGDISDLFQLAKAFGHQQLRERFIDVQLVLEHFGTGDEFLLALLGRVSLGHDVDGLAGQLAGEADILAAATNGKRELIVGNDDLDAFFFLIDHHAGDLCGLERVDDEGRGVFRPGDDVDLFTLHFLHDGLNAAALHADAGADGIDAAVAADDADLGAAARIAGGGHDGDDAIVDFGDFLREQLLHEFGMRAAEENLRPAIFTADVQHNRADAVADADDFARNLLVAADHALGAAQIDDDMAEFDGFHDAGNDLTHAVFIFFILTLTLSVADLLEDDLLGRLGVDAAKVNRGQWIDDEVANHRVLLELLPLLEIDLLEIIFDRFDHFDDAPQAQVTAIWVQLGANVVFGTITSARGALNRVFHRLDDDGLVDHLFARHRIGDGNQFGLVGGNGVGHDFMNPYSSVSNSSAPSEESGILAAISASVSSSLASSTSAKGIRTSPDLASVKSISSPSTPLTTPRKLLRPDTISLAPIFASWPAHSWKSCRRVSGRSMPGELTSRR